MIKKYLIALFLSIAASIAHADSASEVVKYLEKVMPDTKWESAQELKAFPGYFHLRFEGRDSDTQYYFDADKKVLVVGMMVNLNVGQKEANEQSIAAGVSE
jgi:hypothetical protein